MPSLTFFFYFQTSDPASHKENISQFRLQSHYLNVRKRLEEERQLEGAEKKKRKGRGGQQDIYNHQAGFLIPIIFSVIY